MTPLILKYPFDYTGVDPNNLVTGEPHEMVRRKVRAVATNHGPFFTQGLKVYDALNPSKPLQPGSPEDGGQYVAAELYAEASKRTGKEVCAIIVITDQNVSDNIVIDYQVVGGEFSSSVSVIAELIKTLDLDDRPVKWADVLGKPNAFTPAHHLHDLGDIYGFEYVVDALERVRQAILMGDVASHDEIYRYIDHYFNELDAKIAATQQQLDAHKADRGNPHGTTKAQVGLALVENFTLATQVEAQQGKSNGAYMTPLRVAEAIDYIAMAALRVHMADQSNPHATTKAQVGLGLVDNFATASEAEARSGALGTRFMTPLRVQQAIETFALVPLNAHISNTNNPHNTTKAQVGLGSVDNFATATVAQAAAGASSALFVTPAGVKGYCDANVMPTVTAHINNRSNPHGVSAAQVGAYDIAQTNALLNQRLPIGGTAVNSNAFAGLSWAQAYNNIRANLDGSLITTGLVPAPRLGANYTGAWTDVLCGDNNWRPFRSIFDALGLNAGGGIWAGQTSAANALATYAGASPGAFLVVQVGVATEIGTGNGSYWTTYWYNYSYLKIAAGNNWQLMGSIRVA